MNTANPISRFARHFTTMDSGVLAILSAAGLWYLYYLFHTQFFKFTYDVGAHLDYVHFIVKNNALPIPDGKSEFYQPPLYYLIAVGILKVCLWFGYLDDTIPTRLLSLTCFMGFLYFTSAILKETLPSRTLHLLCLACIAACPISTAMASRINNDIMMYWFFSGALYHALRWFTTLASASFRRALIFTGLAIAAKSSGLIMGVILVALWLYQWHRGRTRMGMLFTHDMLIALACAALLVELNLGRILYYHFTTGYPLVLCGNAKFQTYSMLISHDAYYWLSFDYKTYLTEPFFNTHLDETGRQYFWNTVLKSSLFGEFSWQSPDFAIALSFLELLMSMLIISTFISRAVMRKLYSGAMVFHGCALSVSLAILLVTCRLSYPNALACGEDFRYIYPAFISFFCLFGLSIAQCREDNRSTLYAMGMLCAGMFILCSTVILAEELQAG